MEGKKPKILLCEDDPNLGSVLKNYLELSDFDVTLERDGRLDWRRFSGRSSNSVCSIS
jgi:DNA-binding response OmpR family regulator